MPWRWSWTIVSFFPPWRSRPAGALVAAACSSVWVGQGFAHALTADVGRTKFRPRDADQWEPAKYEDEYQADRGADEKVLLGASMTNWVLLYGEMVLVSSVPFVLVGIGAYMMYTGQLATGTLRS